MMCDVLMFVVCEIVVGVDDVFVFEFVCVMFVMNVVMFDV